MKLKIGLVLFLCLLTFRVQTHAQQIAAARPGTPISTTEARSAEQVALPQPSSDIRVQLGKSLLITSQDAFVRVSVTDPTIATAVVVSPTQVLIHGLKAGSETLVLWDSREQARSFNLVVELDINALKQSISQMFPGETLQAMQSGSSLVLTGNVSSKAVAERAGALAGTMSPSVVNLVQITQGRQVVLLQVRFAEVDRTALQQIGMTLFSTGATNTIGVIGTHQFDAS